MPDVGISRSSGRSLPRRRCRVLMETSVTAAAYSAFVRPASTAVKADAFGQRPPQLVRQVSARKAVRYADIGTTRIVVPSALCRANERSCGQVSNTSSTEDLYDQVLLVSASMMGHSGQRAG